MAAERILVVDDDSDLREFVSLLLREAGFDVGAASDGLEGLGKIDALDPDLVLLDLMMPRMDGWEVLRALRGRVGAPVVVMLSAHADRERALRAGAQACLRKPFQIQELIETCRRVLKMKQEP